ncbi:hypothetical protein ACLOJK_038998, partial [Asimina triloba]
TILIWCSITFPRSFHGRHHPSTIQAGQRLKHRLPSSTARATPSPSTNRRRQPRSAAPDRSSTTHSESEIPDPASSPSRNPSDHRSAAEIQNPAAYLNRQPHSSAKSLFVRLRTHLFAPLQEPISTASGSSTHLEQWQTPARSRSKQRRPAPFECIKQISHGQHQPIQATVSSVDRWAAAPDRDLNQSQMENPTTMAGQHHSSSHPIDPAFCKRSSKVGQHPSSPATQSVKPIMHRPANQHAATSSDAPSVRPWDHQAAWVPNPSRTSHEQQPITTRACRSQQGASDQSPNLAVQHPKIQLPMCPLETRQPAFPTSHTQQGTRPGRVA